jgi:hypothetical protein
MNAHFKYYREINPTTKSNRTLYKQNKLNLIGVTKRSNQRRERERKLILT